MESVITNSRYPAEMLEKTGCDTEEIIGEELENKMRGGDWEESRKELSNT